MRQDFAIMKELEKLYKNPLPASRSGVLYNAFAYPTKISPEAIAIYIACHTKIGDTVLDPFAGSGTTGLATLLCDQPTEEMLNTAKALGVKPVWGKRNAVLYELSTLGAFISQVMCNPPDSKKFKKVAKEFISEAEKEKRTICLETSTLKNIRWYQSFGFNIYHELDFGYTLFCLKKE